MITVLLAATAAGCGNTDGGATADQASETTAQTATEPTAITDLSKPDNTKWRRMDEDDVYYQTGISYCETPAAESYEQLAVFVPGAFMNATDNGDGTFTCELNEDAQFMGYTASTAPILLPVITPGYHAEFALTDDSIDELMHEPASLTAFTSQGCIFVHSGCRGMEEGAPAGVTDLKAAIRYLRYSDDVLPGDAESIFAFGMSGGGAQAAIIGASGDSELYQPYLEQIGAVQGVSDAVAGVMAWCPICDLDTANAGYEWMMGCTRTDRTPEEQKITERLAEEFAEYINGAGFTDSSGNALTLTESEEGVYQAGSYYDYIKRVIEGSLNNYLSDNGLSGSAAQEYVDELNENRKWVNYNRATNSVLITSVADFCLERKNASPLPLAFDQPFSQHPLFNCGGKPCHFDSILAGILTELNSEYADDFNSDLVRTDSVGNTVVQRVDMYSPLYYLQKGRGGYGKSAVAENWRIRSGIEQDNTAISTEVNLALALESFGVKTLDFETVWEQKHTEAERRGECYEPFLEWVNECMKNA